MPPPARAAPRRSPGRSRRPRRARRGRGGRGRGVWRGRGTSRSVYPRVVMSPSRPPTATSRSASSHAARERRVEADRQVARVDGRVVVDVVLAAERGGDGHGARLAEGEHVLAGLRAPAALADDDERPLGAGQQLPQARQVAGRGLRPRRVDRGRVRHVGLLEEHVLRQRQHGGARAGPRASPRRRARRARGSGRPPPPGRPTSPRSRRAPRSPAPGRPRARASRAGPGRRGAGAASSPARPCGRRRSRAWRRGRG